MLKKLEISNFRGIKNLSIESFKNINFFIGKANTGKTTVIEAISCGVSLDPDTIFLLSYIRNTIRDDDIFESLFYNYDINVPIILHSEIDKNNYKIKISTYNQDKEIIIQDDKDSEIKELFFNKLFFNILNLNNEKCENHMIGHMKRGRRISFKMVRKKIDINKMVFITSYIDEDLTGHLKNILSNKNKKEEFTKLYRQFDNRIEDIRFIGNKIVVELKKLSHTVNIEYMGKGFQTYLKIIASMVDGNKYIIIDEIENGMHFESIKILFENILLLSKENNLQFFITTHNKELLQILNDILEKNNYEDMLSVYNVYNNEEDNVDIVNFTQSNFSHLIENDNEMRD